MLVFSALKPRSLHLGAQRGDVVVGPQRRRRRPVRGCAPGRCRSATSRPGCGPHRAAEQLIDRHAQRLALDVEQRILDRRDRPLVDAAGACTVARTAVEAICSQAADPRPISASARPGSRAVRPRLPSASVYSDQPTSPSSVVTFRNEKVRQPASQCRTIDASDLHACPPVTAGSRMGN